MKTKNKIRLLLTTLCAAALTLALIPAANAKFLDTGTLDVAPASGGDWFVEYLLPGRALQKSIRVSNFSSVAKNLEIYATGASATDDGNFFAEAPGAQTEGIAKWVRLPVSSITLGPGESRIMSVNFIAPQNAGVGLHTGAVIVRETVPGSGGAIALEKGVRVYLNITGPAITSAQTADMAFSRSPGGITLDVTTRNTGTTDFDSSLKLTARTLTGEIAASSEISRKITPGAAVTGRLSLLGQRPGIYNITLSAAEGQYPLGTVIFVPLWALLLLAAACMAASRRPAGAACFRLSCDKPALQRAAVYFSLLIAIAGLTFYAAGFEATRGEASIVRPEIAPSYFFTVKWGNFRFGDSLALPRPRDWNGKISFSDARISIRDYLHFEQQDSAEITDNNSALLYQNATGPDNDGIMLLVEPLSDRAPVVTYENYATGERYSFNITSCLEAPAVYPSVFHGIYFKADPGPEHVLALMEELEATPEMEATPPPGAIVPELANLFVEDLPATPSALADFVLSSDYVNAIATQRKTSIVETDTILIDALAATPEVLAEIAATPDLNFIFVPDDVIKFPPQEFSFDETRVAAEDIGAMIFVQNKDTPWNTYVGTTDFTSLSGDFVIPASSLTVIPGEPLVLKQNGAKIQTGNPRTFSGTADKTVLVNVDPNASSEQIFVLNPMLQIRIPPGTRPGLYRGTLTITSL